MSKAEKKNGRKSSAVSLKSSLFQFHLACLEGYGDGSLLTAENAMEYLLALLNAGRSLQRKTFAKRERNAEIYRRYLAGEDSVVLGSAYGLSDRRICDIIKQERKRGNQ